MSPFAFFSAHRSSSSSTSTRHQPEDRQTFPQPVIASHHTLYDITLPGTHDSAAYTARPELLSRAHILPLQLRPIRALVASVQKDFALTQTLSVLEQLRAGARFLDIRVSKRPSSTNDTSFWTVHGMVLCVPLADIIQQINSFHHETAANPVTVVTVFRSQQLASDEEQQLSDFVYHHINHPVFEGDADRLRVTPLVQLPQNVIAGLCDSHLSVQWGRDPWLDTYSSDKKISFLHRILTSFDHKGLRNNLLVLGWTVTPQTSDITMRVLSFGLLRPGVTDEAAKMNARFRPFLKDSRDVLRERANVIFFDCFSSRLAAMVNTLNVTYSDTEDSAVSQQS